jgi:hypothetical protein
MHVKTACYSCAVFWAGFRHHVFIDEQYNTLMRWSAASMLATEIESLEGDADACSDQAAAGTSAVGREDMNIRLLCMWGEQAQTAPKLAPSTT